MLFVRPYREEYPLWPVAYGTPELVKQWFPLKVPPCDATSSACVVDLSLTNSSKERDYHSPF